MRSRVDAKGCTKETREVSCTRKPIPRRATKDIDENMTVELSPDNAFEAVLIKMVEMHRKKVIDYAGKNHPNQNFYDTAYQLSLTGGHSVEALISTKQARLRVLLP